MRKLIVSLPFLLYYCIAPVSYDKAGMNKGGNFYGGVNFYAQTGRYSTTTCGTTTQTEYTAFGSQGLMGAYYGFNKHIGAGMEAAFSISIYKENNQSGVSYLPWAYTNLFMKLSIPTSFMTTGIKFGVSGPYYTFFNLSFGFPKKEVFTISYTNLFVNIHSLNLNLAIKKNLVLSAGAYFYTENNTDYSQGFLVGIGLRK